MNWAISIFEAIVTLALLHYVVKGRHVYDGLMEYVRKGVWVDLRTS